MKDHGRLISILLVCLLLASWGGSYLWMRQAHTDELFAIVVDPLPGTGGVRNEAPIGKSLEYDRGSPLQVVLYYLHWPLYHAEQVFRPHLELEATLR